ncbi:YadA-like family protein [Aliivibrio salmonicida]|uniref:YadA C-terminal domain-containing protein n=1 Tax=Aliivibrio salmonicida TaxID=40269 RepID=UPI003D114C68
MKKTILALSLTAIFSSSVMAETIQNPAELPSIDNSVPSVADRPSPDFGNTPEYGKPMNPTQPPVDNSPEYGKPMNPTQPPVDNNAPERPTPDHSPNWGINPDKPVDRPLPQVPTQPPMDNSPEYGKPMNPTQPPVDNNTPERPTPDHSPDWGINPDKPVDRPQPQEPTQPPVDDNSPERPTPDYGDTPDWGIPHTTDGERITTLENDFKTMAEENNRRFNEQDEKIDGVRAGLHAVANARPFVTSGEFAIGAGVGFSGSKEALALGGAYGINEQLSVSGTFHYESSGSYSSSDVAGGVGVQYSFK